MLIKVIHHFSNLRMYYRPTIFISCVFQHSIILFELRVTVGVMVVTVLLLIFKCSLEEIEIK